MMNSKEIVDRYIGALEDDLQHYTMVDKDKVKAKFIEFQLEEYKTIKKDLIRLEQLEIANKNNEGLVRENVELINRNLGLKKVRDNYSDQLNYVWNIVNSLQDEKTKLKQAIKILNNFNFKVNETEHNITGYEIWTDSLMEYKELTYKEYELLKEVFESVGGSDE